MLSEAGILARWESMRRPETLRYPPFLNGQLTKITEAYRFIEKNITLDASINVGTIALATALSWLEFRGLPSFRKDNPRLTNWYDNFSTRPSMVATTLVGDTQDIKYFNVYFWREK